MFEHLDNPTNEKGVYYTVVTPMGNLKAFFDDEDEDGDYPPVVWTGDSEAMQYLEHIAMFEYVDWRGCGVNIQKIVPRSLEGMDGVMGIVVLPCEYLLRIRERHKLIFAGEEKPPKTESDGFDLI